MSIVEKESIEVIAQSIGVGNLSPDVLPALAADIEYRVREIMQEAIKCMHHAKRTAMTSDDVDSALELRKMEPIYVASGNSLRFKRAVRSKDLFYVEDKDVEFTEVIEAPLPKAPLESAVVSHWLAVEGVQPAIPENAPLEVLLSPLDTKKAECKEDGEIVKHVLSIELQLYFEKITELTVSRSKSVIFNKALVSLGSDAGLHPLVPYFIYFVAEEVTRNLNNFQLLFALMRLVRSLVQNPFLHIEPYCAAGLCVYHQLKMIPNLLSPPTNSKKRNQQPLKKVATGEGSHLVKVEGTSSSGFSDVGRRRDKTSSVAVSRAWKKEINAGHLLPKLHDLFGQSMFPFVPSPELSNFHL